MEPKLKAVLSTRQTPAVIGHIKRNLFETCSNEAITKELEAELCTMQARKESRWNYNFTRDIPLTGVFRWETVKKMKPLETCTEKYDDYINLPTTESKRLCTQPSPQLQTIDINPVVWINDTLSILPPKLHSKDRYGPGSIWRLPAINIGTSE